MAKSKKEKKQQAMKKAFKDGKISKKEAKKLSKMGISQAKIQKNYNKQFKPGNVFSFTQQKPGTVFKTKETKAPTYTPLQIGGKAMQKLGAMPQAPAAAPAPAAATPVASGVQQVTQDSYTSPYQAQIDALLDSLSKTQSNLAEQGTGIEGLASQFAEQLAKAQAQSGKELTELQGQLTEQQQTAQEAFQQSLADLTASTQKSLAEQAKKMAEQQQAMKLAAEEAKLAQQVAMQNLASSQVSPTVKLGAVNKLKQGIKAFMQVPSASVKFKGINV